VSGIFLVRPREVSRLFELRAYGPSRGNSLRELPGSLAAVNRRLKAAGRTDAAKLRVAARRQCLEFRGFSNQAPIARPTHYSNLALRDSNEPLPRNSMLKIREADFKPAPPP
jgi:hypothetical protein